MLYNGQPCWRISMADDFTMGHAFSRMALSTVASMGAHHGRYHRRYHCSWGTCISHEDSSTVHSSVNSKQYGDGWLFPQHCNLVFMRTRAGQ